MPEKPPVYRPRRSTAPTHSARPSAAKRGYDHKWRAKRVAIYVRDGGRCRHCSDVIGRKGQWHIDHIQPKARGGTDDPCNLQLLCASCHSTKTVMEDGGLGRKNTP